MKHKDLPQLWKDKIETYLQKKGSKHKQLSAYDFSNNQNVRVTFDDSSYVFFKDSFYWIDEDNEEVAVFTEHCGYHIFNLPELVIETTDWEGNNMKVDSFITE
jgi:predicted glycosyl hydrolase (DUF1957 family)